MGSDTMFTNAKTYLPMFILPLNIVLLFIIQICSTYHTLNFKNMPPHWKLSIMIHEALRLHTANEWKYTHCQLDVAFGTICGWFCHQEIGEMEAV